LISTEPTESVNPQSDVFRELVTRAIEVKVSIVSNDFRESGNREFLNFGHTLGHAIELVEHFKIKHGHAVAIGMCFAAELGRLSGRTNDQLADSIRNTLDALGLPTKYKRENWSALYKAMKIDKKSRGGMLRFIILDELAKPAVLEAPTEEILYQAFLEITD
jgi:3-dehydroquinate synthase